MDLIGKELLTPPKELPEVIMCHNHMMHVHIFGNITSIVQLFKPESFCLLHFNVQFVDTSFLINLLIL